MKSGERINFHTHTARCGHAGGGIDEYCREAVKQGISVLGFSDHAPFPDGRFGSSRMDFSELPDYLTDLARMRRLFPELHILVGLEVDFVPSLGKSFHAETYSREKGIDYRILGPHFTDPPGIGGGSPTSPERARAYTDLMIKAMETGLFDYVAHPDMFLSAYPCWNPELRALAVELAEASNTFGVPFEIIAYGLRMPWIDTPCGRRPQYPWKCFWEVMAEYGVQTVVGSDAHRPVDVWGNTDEAIAFGAELGLHPQNSVLAEKIRRRIRREVA